MLSYACQRCILEHFEANKRFYLSHRCPAISRVEKSIPLKLNELSFSGSEISINTIDRHLEEVYVTRFKVDHIKYTVNFRDKLSRDKRLPTEINLIEAYQQLADRLLNGRVRILVKNFSCIDYITVIETLKVQANNVTILGRFEENVWNLIDVSSHPLRELTIRIVDSKSFDLPGFREVQNLKLHRFNASKLLPNLLTLRNKRIELSCPKITSREVIQLALDWKNNKREIGDMCLISHCQGLRMEDFKGEMKEALDGKLLGKKKLSKGLPRGLIALAIPVPCSPESELLLIGYKREYSYGVSIQLVSVPRGSYRDIVFDHND